MNQNIAKFSTTQKGLVTNSKDNSDEFQRNKNYCLEELMLCITHTQLEYMLNKYVCFLNGR